MEPKVQKYSVTVDDLGDFDLDEDRSIAPSIAFALKNAGINDAVVDQNEFNSAGVEVYTTATQHEVEEALKQDELHAEVGIMEDNEQYVATPPGHFKQDDFTSSVKASKKFKYVPARHGDNGLADEDKQTTNEETEQLYLKLKEEYEQFVADSEVGKKKTEKSDIAENTDAVIQAIQRDYGSIIQNHENELEKNLADKKINASTVKFRTSDIFKRAIETVFRIGRSRADYGKVVATGDVDDLITQIKRMGSGSFVGRFMATSGKDQEALKKELSVIPIGDPFSKTEDYIKSEADVLVFYATRDAILDILANLATARRAGKIRQGVSKAIGDISQAAGVSV
jgi:hypothetical protein